MKYWY